jgi:hypothetical protein
MRRPRRALCVPFVITVSAITGCGGVTDATTDGDAGVPDAKPRADVGTDAAAVDASDGAAPPDAASDVAYLPCPEAVPGVSIPCALPPGATCSYTVACQSGTIEFTLECTAGRYVTDMVWSVISPAECVAHPGDFCAGTELHCSGAWYAGHPVPTNPPVPCPGSLPTVGESCSHEFQSQISPCGYPCDPQTKTGWTVATCDPLHVWTVDTACAP